MSQDRRADWEIRQARTFEKWCSIYLKRAGYPAIGEGTEQGAIDNCFRTGVNLINLLDALYKGSDFEQKVPKHKKNPKTQLARLDNLSQAVKVYDKIGINRKGWTREQIAEGVWNMTLGMMWCTILHANVSLIKEENSSGKKGLLMWCRKQCKGYAGLDGRPKNFTTNWKDGRVFNALLHRYYPDRVDYDAIDPANAADNIEHAFKNFEELGIDRLIEVEDMLVEKPDDKQVMCYVSELFKFLSKQDFKGQAKDHVIRFMQFQKRIQGLCGQYENGAKEYLSFAEAQQAEWAGKELAADKGGAQQDIEGYKNFVKEVLPAWSVKRIDLETLFANVQTELSANGRTAWECPAEIQPDTLEKVSHDLAQAQSGYFEKIRQHRFSFIEVQEQAVDEEVQAEIVKAFDVFDKDGSGFLDREEFYAAMAAVGVAIPEDQQESTYAGIAGADGRISKSEYVKYMTAHFDTSDTADAILASASKLGDTGKLDFGAAGFTGDELALAQELCPDGNINEYVNSSFKS